MPEKKTIEEMNDDLVKELTKKEDYWNNTISNITKKLNCTAQETVDLQAESLSQKQMLSDEIKYMTYELYKFMPILKKQRKSKIEFYLSKYPLKTQGPDRLKLIESDLAFYDQRKDIYDTHIEFLRESLKTMEQIGYAIKNKVTLYNLTGLE
jgi:predicted nucleotidyltransferase